MQVKIFRAYKSDAPGHLERQINNFLNEPGGNVLEIHTFAVDNFVYVLIEHEDDGEVDADE